MQRKQRMEIIPVVDLKGGFVVRAQQGNRDAYRPIETPLSPSSAAVDVVRGLLALHEFRTLYIADLDAIMAKGDNLAAIRGVHAAFPALDLWIDNGAADSMAIDALKSAKLGAPVIGSETQRGAELLTQAVGAILSLDFRGDAFQGPQEILDRPQLWPERIIVMALARVGSGAGPDFERLKAIRAGAGARRIYAAGGVRDVADLIALKKAGIAGALIATALHDRRLGAAEIKRLAQTTPEPRFVGLI